MGARQLPSGAGHKELTAKPGHCSPGAETCRVQHRNTWVPRPSAREVWGAVEELWISDGRATPSSFHPPSTCPDLATWGLTGGTQCSWATDRASPICCAYTPLEGLVQGWRRGDTPLLAVPWNCPPCKGAGVEAIGIGSVVGGAIPLPPAPTHLGIATPVD